MKRLQQWWTQQSGSARLRIVITAGLLGLAVLFSSIGLIGSQDWDGFFLNLGAELGGAAVTFLLLDQLLARRERAEEMAHAEQQIKTDLIAKMSSEVREIAVPAADELRRHNWLIDGSMADAMLRRANLEGVNLANADLRGANMHRTRLNNADLWRTNLAEADLGGAWLQGARLWDTNLEGANLWQARVQNADLRRANLENAEANETKFDESDLREVNFKRANLREARLTGAVLQEANLTEADLTDARLEGVNLRGAILRRAILEGAVFDNKTILPDGKHWLPGVDLSGYLDDE
ncbi:MAG: pentapeptide repeat-containing protein [Anaerolineae bacterium]